MTTLDKGESSGHGPRVVRTMHLADPTRLHGIRCNHRGDTERTFYEILVTCSQCRGLGRPVETPPENAFTLHGFMSITHIDRDGQRLDLDDIVFADGGSLLWFEEPDVLAVMHAKEGGTVRRYQGTWKATAEVAGA